MQPMKNIEEDHMIKRVTVIMLVFVLAVPLIFADGEQEKVDQGPVVIDIGDVMTGSMVNGHGHDGFYEEYVLPKFREMYPDVEIKDPPTTLAGRGMESVEKFLIAVATNDVPDLIGGGEENPPAYGDRGILLDLVMRIIHGHSWNRIVHQTAVFTGYRGGVIPPGLHLTKICS